MQPAWQITRSAAARLASSRCTLSSRPPFCVSVGYGGDLNIAKTRAQEAKNGVEIEVLAPKSGVGIWVDSLMIPRDAQNTANAHKYINHTLDPEVAAQNGDRRAHV